MTRPAVDWQMVRAEWEAGGPLATDRALAKKHGTTHTTVRKHRINEGWRQAFEPQIRRLVSEKLAATGAEPSAGSPEATAAAINAEAERRTEVINRHRDEWNAARTLIYDAMKAHKAATRKDQKNHAYQDLRAGYLAARALAVVQAGERRAWRIDDNGNPPPDDDTTLRIVYESAPYPEESEDREDDDA